MCVDQFSVSFLNTVTVGQRAMVPCSHLADQWLHCWCAFPFSLLWEVWLLSGALLLDSALHLDLGVFSSFLVWKRILIGSVLLVYVKKETRLKILWKLQSNVWMNFMINACNQDQYWHCLLVWGPNTILILLRKYGIAMSINLARCLNKKSIFIK